MRVDGVGEEGGVSGSGGEARLTQSTRIGFATTVAGKFGLNAASAAC